MRFFKLPHKLGSQPGTPVHRVGYAAHQPLPHPPPALTSPLPQLPLYLFPLHDDDDPWMLDIFSPVQEIAAMT